MKAITLKSVGFLFVVFALVCLVCVAENRAHGADKDTLPPLNGGTPPRNVQELWAGYSPLREPLDVEVTKEWNQDGVALKVVRYRIGVFKGRKSMMAAIYGYPEGGRNLPGLVQIHGGGQSADVNAVLTNAKRGYACISINWGGNPLGGAPNYQGPNTDWGAVDATQTTHNDHFFSFQPDNKTIDSVVSPRNNNWFLLTMAVRRALTFLQRQPEVNPRELGVYGHSMGGNLTLYVAGVDRRVKAAVITSAGGIGDESDNLKNTPFSNAAYASRVTCPVLFENPSDDFHGTILGVEETAETIKSKDYRFSRPPQLNHRDMPAFTVTGMLWFDHYLKGGPPPPRTPTVSWNLKTQNGVPLMKVMPDPSRRCVAVDIYYTQDSLTSEPKSIPNCVNRFWRHVSARKSGATWEAALPILSINKPLWAYANVCYDLPKPIVGAGYYYQLYTATNFVLSSHLLMASSATLQMDRVSPTLKISRLIESFAPGWKGDWYTFNYNRDWPWRTHKLHSVEYTAPPGAKLAVDVRSAQKDKLVIGLDDYAAQTEIEGGDSWQTVSFSPADFHNASGQALSGWRRFGELALADMLTLNENNKYMNYGGIWRGPPPEFRNLRWIETGNAKDDPLPAGSGKK